MKRLENKKLARLLTFVLTMLLSGSAVYAHAKLLASQPADGAVLQQAPKRIELTFNQQLQAAEMSAIIITDADGKRVDKNNVTISDDGKKLRCDLNELTSGVYAVEWKTLSADNHSIKGKFTFTISSPTSINDAAQTGNVLAPTSDESAQKPAAPRRETSPPQEFEMNPARIFARWLAYLAMMTLFGGFAFLLFALKPSLANAPNLSAEEVSRALQRGTNRFAKLGWLCLGLLFLTALADLMMQASSLFGANDAPAHFRQVLTQTSYGFPWLLQIASIIALSAIIFFGARRNVNSEISGFKRTMLWRVGFVVCALLFLTPSLTGHAQAAAKTNQFAVFSDWLHLAASGIWVGGLFHLILTLPPSVAGFSTAPRRVIISRVIGRFSRLAVAATILLALTGVYNSLIHVDNLSALTSSSYGIVLLFKAFLFLPMLLIGGYNTFVLRPRLERLTTETTGDSLKTSRDFYRAVKVEAALGVVVLLLAAVLAFLPTASERQQTLINDNSREQSKIFRGN